MQDQGTADEEEQPHAEVERGIDSTPVEGEHEGDVRDVQEEHQTGDEQREKGAEHHQPEPADEWQEEEAHLNRARGTFKGEAYDGGDLQGKGKYDSGSNQEITCSPLTTRRTRKIPVRDLKWAISQCN